MTAAGWERVKQLFAQALDLPEAEREAFLDRECAGDEDVRAGVERLLAGDARPAAAALEAGIGELIESAVPQATPAEIGSYRILEVLGEGGMGRVYLAEQTDPVKRRVAVKLIKLGMDTRRVLERFEAERQALARMEHDSIAKIFDAGRTESGQPYFVMEYVDGVPLGTYCDRHRLDVAARLELFRRVCAGVQHAHQKGLIHRDLKPSNILVTEQTGRAVPKIIDFGIAKATDPLANDTTQFTELGQVIGTPDYMSPEQAAHDADVDTRSDVFSLGVLLYELLTGDLPFGRSDERGSPVRPSAKVRELRGDLEWILLRALEADRERRYATPKELADDLHRHLQNEPVEAGPPSPAYRFRKFLRRNRLRVGAVAAVLLSLVAGLFGTMFYLFEARAKANEASAHLDRFNLLANVIRLDEARAILEDGEALFPAWPDKAAALREWIEKHGNPLARELPKLRKAVAAIQVESQADQFLHDALARLVEDLEAFTAPKAGALAQVRARLVWAETIRDRTIQTPAARWRAAREAIRTSARYAEARVDLTPQLGLVPIGENPKTGLWEFYHPRSATHPDEIPVHDENGHIPVNDDTGLIFVLIPGAPFEMGAQRSDVHASQYDAGAKPHEGLHQVDLDPYFLARHELTQGQWIRLSPGPNPSSHAPPWDRPDDRAAPVTLKHPTENVSFPMCVALLKKHALDLPTEEQWEFACRAGTRTPWFTGKTPASLLGHANILDQTAGRAVSQWGAPEPIDDGFISHAPVGTFKPNTFGLYDMHGNVWEWCHGGRGSPNKHLLRGGGFTGDAADARTAARLSARPNTRSIAMGLRAARRIMP